MATLKSTFLSLWLALGATVTSSAHAYTPLNYNDSSSYVPSSLIYAGSAIPCHLSASFRVDSSGMLTVTGFVFTQLIPSDSVFCNTLVANSLPWNAGTATLISGSGSTGVYQAALNDVSITIPAFHVTCSGSATITINDGTGDVGLNATLHNGAIPCAFSTVELSSGVKAP